MQRCERGEKDGDLAAHGAAVGQPYVDLEDMPHVQAARHELSRPDAAANAGEAAATMGAQPAVAVEIDAGPSPRVTGLLSAHGAVAASADAAGVDAAA